MDLSAWFADTVTIKSLNARTSSGDPTYGAAREIKARVQNGRDRDADQIPHDVVLYTESVVLADDRVWLPGESLTVANARRPIKVNWSTNRFRDTTLYEVLL